MPIKNVAASSRTPRRVLVVRTDRMGDVLLSTPVLSALKYTFPQVFVAILLRTYTFDLVSGHPDADLLMCDDEPSHQRGIRNLVANVLQLRRHRFDSVLVLHPTFRLALVCWLAGIPHRYGTAYRGYSWLFNHRVKIHRKKSGRHELDLNLQMAEAFGATLPKVEFKFFIPAAANESIQEKLRQQGIVSRQRFVVLHAGSGGSALDWPPEKFAELAVKLYSDLGLTIVLTGSKSEKPLVDRVANNAKCPIVRMDGQLNVKELAALLGYSALVVANSTGPLHLAVAVGADVIGLYCPLLPCRPERWGPYGKLDSVIMPPLEACQICDTAKCRHGNCMELITVEQVLQMAVHKLADQLHVRM